MNYESAIAFVRKHGTGVEQARLRYILHGEHIGQQVVNDLLTHQRADGGWAPFWASDYSSLDATCFRLAQAEQLGISDSETPVRRAIRFLVQRQRADGSWEEDESVAPVAPLWAQPGEKSARLYLTANCGFWVATFGVGDATAMRAADYLQSHLAPNGHLPSFLHAHWLAGGLWYRLNHRESAQRALNYLSTRLPDMSGNHLTWLLTTLLSAGIPADNTLIQTAASRLEEHQSADGHWASDDGPHQDVHVTLEALRALSLSGRFA